jgi:hypothetical protein
MMAIAKWGAEGKPPFVPTEEWIEAFERQLDDSLYDAAWRYAGRRAAFVGRVRKIDEGYAQGLVADIIEDTLAGVISWDPERVELRKFVLDAIKSRTRHDYLRARRQRHFSLDDGGMAALDRVAALEHETEPEKAERLQAVDATIAAVRTAAADAPDVLRLLDAYENGAETRAEVLQMTGLTKLQYDAARKRLDRILEDLPAQLAAQTRRTR